MPRRGGGSRPRASGWRGSSAYHILGERRAADRPRRPIRACRRARVLRPQDKLRSGLGVRLRRIATTPSPPAATETFLIEASSALTVTELARAVSERGATSAREVLPGLYAIDAMPQRIEAIAELSSVLSIDVGPPRFAPLADGARDAAGIDRVQGFRLDADLPVLDGLSGRGVSIAIFDTAIDEGVRDFCDLSGDPAVDRFFRRDSDMSVCDTDIYAGGVGNPLGDPHGTHVAGIAAGTGRNSALPGNPLLTPPPPFTFRGVAPEARLGEFVQVKSKHVALEAFRLALLEDGADVSNHSYIESLGPYGTWSGFLDALVSGRRPQAISETEPSEKENDADGQAAIPRRPQVWAAGNSGVRARFGEYGNRAGYYSVYTQAKNTISVGAYDIDHGRVSVLSSLGPTFDGRVKPDLVAPGCYDSRDPVNLGLRGPRPGTQLYLRLCGTSMAAPVVSGTIALMQQAAERPLLPSSYKAALVATATDLVAAETAPSGWTDNPQTGDATRYGAGPDFASGFGLLDGRGAVAVVSEPGHLHEGVIGGDDDGESAIFCTRLDGDTPVAVALAWDDVPGAQLDFNAATLVNDLDLELRAPDGTQHLPWTLEAPETAESLEQIMANGVDTLPPERIRAAVPGRDSVNTVERVDLNAPEPGLWRVVVSAPRLGAGPQDFSLVLTSVIEDCPVPE